MLEIRFLDVGQGDAILIRTPEGDILIDAGSDATQETLCLRLEALGVEKLALAVFTHSDEDHLGGGDGVLRRFPTEKIWITDYFEPSEAVERLLYAADATDAEVVYASAGLQFLLGDAVITALSPEKNETYADANDASLLIKLVCGEVSALLMGDASETTEQRLLERYRYAPAQLSCDLFKVAHHGASNASSAAFLKTVDPQYAVISCGAGNSYGHPHGETLERLTLAGAEIYRTDRSGELVFLSDGYKFWTEKSSYDSFR